MHPRGLFETILTEVLAVRIAELDPPLRTDSARRTTRDVIIIDELHHAAAPSYSDLVERFRPRELFGRVERQGVERRRSLLARVPPRARPSAMGAPARRQ